MNSTVEYKLHEIADVQTGPFGTQLHQKDYVQLGTPIITVEHLGESKVKTENLPLVSEEDKKRLIKYSLKTGDVVFSRVGSVDRRSYVSENENGWLFSGRCLRVRANSKLADGKYLSYYFGQETFKEHIRRIAVGATMPSINTKILEGVQISLPPLPTQHAIAAILTSLDDKIELNNAINKNLEALAQTLFKQWFLEFEFPMTEEYANSIGKPELTGQPYKSNGGEMVESEMGLIPKGWKAGELGDLCNLIKKTVKPFEHASTSFSHFSLPAFDEGKLPTKEFGKQILSSKFMVLSNCLLVSKLNPRFPRIWPIKIAPENAICSTEFQVLLPKKDEFYEYLIQFCSTNEFSEELSQRSSGTSGSHQRVRPDEILALNAVIPTSMIFILFTEIVKNITDKIIINRDESNKLMSLRDTLLPKLITGQIEII